MNTTDSIDNLMDNLCNKALEKYVNTNNFDNIININIFPLLLSDDLEQVDTMELTNYGNGHCSEDIIVKILIKDKIKYIQWIDTHGSCDECDMDIELRNLKSKLTNEEYKKKICRRFISKFKYYFVYDNIEEIIFKNNERNNFNLYKLI